MTFKFQILSKISEGRGWCARSISIPLLGNFSLLFLLVRSTLWPWGSYNLDLCMEGPTWRELFQHGRTPALFVFTGEFLPPSPPAVCSCLPFFSQTWPSAKRCFRSTRLSFPPLKRDSKDRGGNTLWTMQVTPLPTCPHPESRKLSVTSSLGVVCCSDLLWLFFATQFCVSLPKFSLPHTIK